MPKKKKSLKKQQKMNRREKKYNGSSTSTSTDINEFTYGIEKLKIDEENEDFFLSQLQARNDKEFKNSSILSLPRGLYNLGNTCYLNSIIQVLNQTPLFYELLNERADSGINWYAYYCSSNKSNNENSENSKNLKTKLNAPKILNSCLVTLLHSLKSELKSLNVIKPESFFREVTSCFNQFKGNDQQDSYEFLRCLLDGLKVGEIKRQKKAILDALGLDFKKLRNCNEETNELLRGYSESTNFTLIDSLFGGYCISSLKCEDCENTSQIFEPFLDLSLAISEENINLTIRRQKNITKEKNVDSNLQNKNLLEVNVKNLTTKERKFRKQLRKARKENKRGKDLNRFKSNSLSKKDTIAKDVKNSLKVNDDDDRSLIEDDEKCLNNSNDKEKTIDSSDDERSSKEEGTLDSKEKSDVKQTDVKNKNFQTSLNCNYKMKHLSNFNSIDSGINHSNLTSDADNAKTKLLMKSTLPLHEENIDLEKVNNKEVNNLNSDEKESDTGFEDKESILNGEADSENESSDTLNEEKESDSDKNDNQSQKIIKNEYIFNDNKTEEKKSILSNSKVEDDDLFKKKIKWTLTTVSNKLNLSDQFSILTCLSRFTKLELLFGANRIYCENCSNKHKNKNGTPKKIYTNGFKQMLIAFPPPVLTLHLKRFELNSYRNSSLSKINKHVPFPLVFNLSPYVSKVYKIISNLCTNYSGQNDKLILYSLYGVVEHLGSMRSGHYKAYVRHQNKNSDKFKKFLRLKPYVPKILDVLNLITDDDLNSNQDEELTDSDEPTVLKEELLNLSRANWFHISDSDVTHVPLKNVLKAQAYLLFYERII